MSLKTSGRAIPAVPPDAASPASALLFEERTRDFLRAAAAWVWETDEHLRLTRLARAATAHLGMPAQLLLGHSLAQLATAHGDSEALLLQMRTRQAFRNKRFRLRRPTDGTEVILLLSGVPAFDPMTGRFSGYRGTGGDEACEASPAARPADTLESEVKRLSAEVNDLRLALQQHGRTAEDDSIVEELARLSHELRSPLNAIIGYAELAQQAPNEPLPQPYQKWMERIRTAARHLQGVVDNLTGAQASASRASEVDDPACRLDEAVSEALSIVSMDAERQGVQWAIDTGENQRVAAPQSAVVQILLNLLSNAVKFSPPGGRVSLEGLRDENEDLAGC